MDDLSSFGTAVRHQAPMLAAIARRELEVLSVSAADVDGLIARGVPFHMAAQGEQDEQPSRKTYPKRLAAGETLFLVQPHEYMPRLRRFIHQAGRALGFAGRPARSFLFRVDVPGREAMGMHDDGETDLLWLQLGGERFVTFGTRDAKGAKQSLSRADGDTAGWFRGGLKAGDILYLPPHSPHEVACRRPSIGLSIYWERVSAELVAAEWLGYLAAEGKPLTAVPSEASLRKVLRQSASAPMNEWLALRATDDGGRDQPPETSAGAANLLTPWRAWDVFLEGREAVLVAGGEKSLAFPAKIAPVLKALAHYSSVERGDLIKKARGVTEREFEAMLSILEAEGLVIRGDLPTVGTFEPNELSGWEYTDK